MDKVAASGGYLMACGADRLRAAPFAVIGSIGVVAQLPNLHRLLKRHDIDVELLTAGRYKRTLTVFGENTDEGRDKFVEDLETTHRLFKRHVAERRPDLNIEAVATGEIWYGSDALVRGLVDELGTSEAYLVERMGEARVISVKLEQKPTLSGRLGMGSRVAWSAASSEDWRCSTPDAGRSAEGGQGLPSRDRPPSASMSVLARSPCSE